MTNRILSENDVDSVTWSAEVGDHIVGGVKIVDLCTSHRLLVDELANERSISDRLMERIAELETIVSDQNTLRHQPHKDASHNRKTDLEVDT